MNAGMWDGNAGIFDVVTRDSKQQYLNILNLLQDVTQKADNKIPPYILSCCVYKLPTTETLSASVPVGKNAADSVFSADISINTDVKVSFSEKFLQFLKSINLKNFFELLKKVGTKLASSINNAARFLSRGGSLKEYFLLPEVNSLFTEEQMNTIRQYIKIHKCASGNDLNEALASKNVIMLDDQALYPAYMLRQLRDRNCAVHMVSLQTQGD